MINFDIISSDLKQDAFSVVRGMRILRDQHFFKDIDRNEYVIWLDTGKSFRNSEVLGYFLVELAEKQIKGKLVFKVI